MYSDTYFCPYLDIYCLYLFCSYLHVSQSPYLHVSQFVSARIPALICTYLSSHLNVYKCGSARVLCVCRYVTVSASALLVSASALKCTFDQISGQQASQITPHTHAQLPTHGDAPILEAIEVIWDNKQESKKYFLFSDLQGQQWLQEKGEYASKIESMTVQPAHFVQGRIRQGKGRGGVWGE